MEQTVRVIQRNGLLKTGHSPKIYLKKGEDGMPITKINREFDKLAQQNLTDRENAERTRGEERLAKSRNLTTRLAEAVKNRLTAFTSGTKTEVRDYLRPNLRPIHTGLIIEGETRSNSPNSGGGYNSRKLKKPTVLAKKPKKPTVLAKKPKKVKKVKAKK
jgi:hypothetical protein